METSDQHNIFMLFKLQIGKSTPKMLQKLDTIQMHILQSIGTNGRVKCLQRMPRWGRNSNGYTTNTCASCTNVSICKVVYMWWTPSSK